MQSFSKGVTEQTVLEISRLKQEPGWMTEFRLAAFRTFQQLTTPSHIPQLANLNLEDITYYVVPEQTKKRTWEEVPADIKATFDKLGIPKAEQEILAGVETQVDSNVLYESLNKELEQQGVVFLDTDTALEEFPDIFREYFGKIVPPQNNKFAALNSAMWSGGSFVYIPKGIQVTRPLQAFFRINARKLGQFERTLIVLEEDSYVHYIEGCTAPTYSESALHAGVGEIVVKKGARAKYTTIQNWSKNVFNLSTKRAVVYKNASMEWTDGNIGSGVTMKYPTCELLEQGAHGEMLSVAYAGKQQALETGANMLHKAPNTTSTIVSKCLVKDGGSSTFKGSITISENATQSKGSLKCDGLILDDKSYYASYPTIKSSEQTGQVQQETSAGKLEETKLAYLQSRGLTKPEAEKLLIGAFIEPVITKLPIEYALEFNQLLNTEITK